MCGLIAAPSPPQWGGEGWPRAGLTGEALASCTEDSGPGMNPSFTRCCKKSEVHDECQVKTASKSARPESLSSPEIQPCREAPTPSLPALWQVP